MNFKSLIAMLCAGSMAAWAANNASVQAPMTGYIFDAQARAVRPMIGMPGGAYLGTPIATGLDAAWVSPDGSTAFAMEKGQLTLYVGLGGANPTGVPVNGAIAPDSFAWSPDSTGAAIYAHHAAGADPDPYRGGVFSRHSDRPFGHRRQRQRDGI